MKFVEMLEARPGLDAPFHTEWNGDQGVLRFGTVPRMGSVEGNLGIWGGDKKRGSGPDLAYLRAGAVVNSDVNHTPYIEAGDRRPKQSCRGGGGSREGSVHLLVERTARTVVWDQRAGESEKGGFGR